MTRRGRSDLWPRRLSSHPRGRDAIVAAVILLIGLALLQFGLFPMSARAAVLPPDGTVFLLTLGGMTALATQRSTRPMLVLALGSAITVLDLLHGSSPGVVLAFTDVVYCAIKYGSVRGVRITIGIAVGLAIAAGVAMFVLRPDGPVTVVALQWALIVLIGGLWGWNVRSERMRTRAAMSDQHMRSMLRMRQRIAHDLHDLVANQIAVAGLHVEAARLRIESSGASTPEIERSLDQVTSGTEQAHQQLRRLIAVLTTVDDLAEPAPPHVAEALAALARLPPAGRSLVWTGAGAYGVADACVGLSPRERGIVTRALQELVANAVKHGIGDVTVDVSAPSDSAPLTVTVENALASDRAPAAGSGIGITGAALLLRTIGASLDASADALRGRWRALATIPMTRDRATLPDGEEHA
ncbi:sensor histidine kinase [Microbacterium karelineae]|uniref:sensor histidine kinase n=1 Tax=Microbacterium karelineae TaxID=2654283 RepID=UPI0018D34DDF|nr:histidine kinase [Microbacterium karelineae]